MDGRLVAWARSVKARRRQTLPVLWFFTDSARVPDPVAVVACLPRGLCGVVARDLDPALLARLARTCRARRIPLSVARDWRLARALGAWSHARRGRRPGRGLVLTASAHGAVELRRARRSGARLIFLSPAFSTASHPGARALGPSRWNRLRRGVPGPVAALGGVTGRNARRLGRACDGAGAIGAFLD